MDQYEKGVLLGQGTFGSVFKAIQKKTGKVVAIKKVRIANIKEVFEYMESDLEAVINDKAIVLAPGDIKSYMSMFLQSLEHIHSRWILHRDIKPNNLLLAPNGNLCLADFGLARTYGSPPDRPYTNQVFARWYRPPELLFGSTIYSSAIDIWAAGCVFAELMLRRPWLPGKSDIDQLGKIFQALGTPTEAQWPAMKELPNYVEFQRVPAPPLRSLIPKASEDALDLLSNMVAFNPNSRPSAAQALRHRYFTSQPQVTPPQLLPRPQKRESNPLMLAQAPVDIMQLGTQGGGGSPARKRPRMDTSPLAMADLGHVSPSVAVRS